MESLYGLNSLRTGIVQIDRDHEAILALVTAFYAAIHDKKDHPLIVDFCSKLVETTEEHFRQEEAYMERAGFPGLGEHKCEHDRLTEEARGFLMKIEHETPGADIGLYYVLRELFVAHILEYDKEFGVYYMQRAME